MLREDLIAFSGVLERVPKKGKRETSRLPLTFQQTVGAKRGGLCWYRTVQYRTGTEPAVPVGGSKSADR